MQNKLATVFLGLLAIKYIIVFELCFTIKTNKSLTTTKIATKEYK